MALSQKQQEFALKWGIWTPQLAQNQLSHIDELVVQEGDETRPVNVDEQVLLVQLAGNRFDLTPSDRKKYKPRVTKSTPPGIRIETNQAMEEKFRSRSKP